MLALMGCYENEKIEPMDVKKHVFGWWAQISGAQDYTDNLWDEWVVGQGMILDANNADLDSWAGYRNSVGLTATLTTEDKPVNGVLTLPLDGQGFTITSSNPGVNATDVTFAFLLQKSSAHAETNGIWLFDNVGPTPRVILKFEISDANSNLGFQWNGVDKDFGAAFPFDGDYHVLIYHFSGTEGRCYVDGVQVGNTITGLTGGSFAMNTSVSTRRFLRGGLTITRNFKGNVKKFRVYLEALSTDNITLISNQSNSFYLPLSLRNARLFNLIGQSNMEGNGAWSGLPAYLTGNLERCYLWVNATRVFTPLSSTSYTLDSPILEFAYRMAQAYPAEDIFIVMGAVGGTNLAVDWLPPSGARYTNNKGWCDDAIDQLGIQYPRTIVQRGGGWLHGETDSQNLTYSNNYQANEVTLFTQWRTDFGHTIIASGRLHDLLPAGSYPYRTTVNSGKDTNAGSDSNIKLFNTDDQGVYPVSGDNLHYTQDGFIAVGAKLATYF